MCVTGNRCSGGGVKRWGGGRWRCVGNERVEVWGRGIGVGREWIDVCGGREGIEDGGGGR